MIINLEIKEQENIDLDFGLENTYTGTYKPIPSLEGYTIKTANKKMLGDIEVEPIPVNIMTNPSNGYTYVIGQ